MKQLTCEMCGSTDIAKQDGFFVCQTCGIKYSLEEAKKMMIEGTVEVQGTVKIDDTSKIENYLTLAEDAWEMEESYEKANKYCDMVLEINSQNPDAWRIKGLSLIDYAAFESSISNKEKLINDGYHAFLNALNYETKSNINLKNYFQMFVESMKYTVEACAEGFAEHSTNKTIKCIKNCLHSAISKYEILLGVFESKFGSISEEDITTVDKDITANKKLKYKYECVKEVLSSFNKSVSVLADEYYSSGRKYFAKYHNAYNIEQADNPYVYKFSLSFDLYDDLIRQFVKDEVEYRECKKLLIQIYESEVKVCSVYNSCISRSTSCLEQTYSCKEGRFSKIDENKFYNKIKELDSTYKTPEEKKAEFKPVDTNNYSNSMRTETLTVKEKNTGRGIFINLLMFVFCFLPVLGTIVSWSFLHDDNNGSVKYNQVALTTLIINVVISIIVIGVIFALCFI